VRSLEDRGFVMETSPRHRRIEQGGLIVCVLYGIVVGLMTGGWQAVLRGGFVGLMTGCMFASLISRLGRISRQAMIGGVAGAALFVALGVLWPSPLDEAVTLPMAALSGFALGGLVMASPMRFLVAGALIGGLPMPLIGLVAYTIASGNRQLTLFITIIPVMALLWAAFGWLQTRSLAAVWPWALLGAIIGLGLLGIDRGMALFSGPRTPSRPITPSEMMLSLKIMTGVGALLGAWLGAVAGNNSIFPGGPKLFNDQNKS
jgi:hypothetical protein